MDKWFDGCNKPKIDSKTSYIDTLIWTGEFDLDQMTLIIKLSKLKIFGSE